MFFSLSLSLSAVPADETIDALKEATLLKQLQHPFVIGYYDAFTVNEPHGQSVDRIIIYISVCDLVPSLY